MKRVFLDMDGVIVNFAKAFEVRAEEREPGFLVGIGYRGDFKEIEDLIQLKYEKEAKTEKEKKKAKYKAKDKFWKFVFGDVNWWVDMECLPDGKELFDALNTMRKNGLIGELNILSAPAKRDPCVPDAKRKWLEKHGVTPCMDRIIIENDKYKFAETNNDILIDDTVDKLTDWANAGGTPLLHKNTVKTLDTLNSILVKNCA